MYNHVTHVSGSCPDGIFKMLIFSMQEKIKDEIFERSMKLMEE